ncbi:alginate O-acetyltransferase AlgX-related protein [Tardiphaga sp. vice278]|uniref:alginate O-acetyltransferase AlgX-related protein n=1 Tax=Tardiphaga sp. vice278 TaxID=2592815 RepID=UPI001161FA3D|nr:hypothetical protein [Tardiphaga sp. vice278]QDM17979.1 hypothetical protein FNL53_20005 [Tardiphaga sp. vice278]
MARQSYFPVATFFAILLIPITLFGIDFGRSDFALGDFPSSLSRKSPRDFENWFTTRLGLRSLATSIGARLNFDILRRTTSPLVVFGKGDWIFTADSGDMSGPPPRVADVRGILRADEKTISGMSENFAQNKTVMAQCGGAFLALVAPNKQSVYGDYLTNAGWPTDTRLTSLLAKLSPEARAVVQSPRDDMLKFRSERPDLLLYHKTGSHWNDLGAWVAYKGIVDKLAKEGAIYAPDRAGLENFNINSSVIDGENMDLVIRYAKKLFTDVEVRLISKANPPLVGQVGTEPLIPPGFDRTEYTNPNGKGRLLYMGDSFGARLVPLLARHFESAVYMDYPFVLTSLVAKYRPTVVILESIERNVEKMGVTTSRLDTICR